MLDDLITRREPPPNRTNDCDGGVEHHLSQGAVMVAFAMYLLRTVPELKSVAIHPDGEHGKRFDFPSALERRGFTFATPIGSTSYGGTYGSAEGKTVPVNPKPGQGDVVAVIGNQSFVAECKGGVVNTRHPGQQSRLRQGLCETVGLSLTSPIVVGRRQFAVAPRTKATEMLAQRLAARAAIAGIEIMLVEGNGTVRVVEPPNDH